MALDHASSGQAITLLPPDLDLTKFSAIALTKTAEIELIRLILPAGKEMPEHHVKGEITVQCLAGELAFITDQSVTLKAGEMLYLEGGKPHALRAVSDAVALVTILLRH